MSGLAAGIRYAYMGRRVLVVDRHYRVGGLNSYYRAGGRNLDVGLHAMTNYRTDKKRSAPLAKLLRQLKFKFDDFDLVPQNFSKISFPEKELRFSNDKNELIDSIAEKFPGQAGNFIRLIQVVEKFNELDPNSPYQSARKTVSAIITDPLLVEMIFCPLMYYGSAAENDTDFWIFVVMFKSLYLEGFCRPQGGVRPLLDLMTARLDEVGCELKLSNGVKSIETDKGKVTGVIFDDDQSVECDIVFSSAGLIETRALAKSAEKVLPSGEAGKLSFVETINFLDKPAKDLGEEATIIFYSNTPEFHYEKATTPVDLRSGVICFPGNFKYTSKPDGIDAIRTTHIADYDHWFSLDDKKYKAEKEKWSKKSVKTAAKISIDTSAHITFTDVFTPKTIRRFTGHVNGCVYGTPQKVKTGKTNLDGLYLCGTDQGYLGIVGAMLSGISMANLAIVEHGGV